VQKVFGPGNAYVVAAKRMLFGHVAVDLLPGPSEVLVLADDTADPAFAAADLLAQAEHGSGHERVWLITPSHKVLRRVEKEIDRQIKTAEAKDEIRDPAKSGVPMQTLMTALIYAGKDSMGSLCPVFALRLRGPDGRQAADDIRQIMRTWGEES